MYKTIIVGVIRIVNRTPVTEPTATARRCRHPELARIVVLPGSRRGWWWLTSRRVPGIQPRIDGVRLVTVRRVPVLVHEHWVAGRRDDRHFAVRLQVLLGPVELGPGKVRAIRSGPTALREVLLGTVQGVFGIAIKVILR